MFPNLKKSREAILRNRDFSKLVDTLLATGLREDHLVQMRRWIALFLSCALHIVQLWKI